MFLLWLTQWKGHYKQNHFKDYDTVFPHIRPGVLFFFRVFHPKVTVHKAKGHNVRVLSERGYYSIVFEGGSYMRKYGKCTSFKG